MSTATFSVRMNNDLKKNFTEICNSFGMNVSTAINVFATAVVNQKRLPFDVVSNIVDDNNMMHIVDLIRQDTIKSGASNMSLDDINKEIKLARKGAKRK